MNRQSAESKSNQGVINLALFMEELYSDRDTQSILMDLLRRLEDDCPGLTIALLEIQTDRLATRVSNAPDLFDSLTFSNSTSGGTCGVAAALQQTSCCEDIEVDASWDNCREVILERGLRSCMAVPVYLPGSDLPYGVLGLFHGQTLKSNSPTEALATQAARFAGIILQRDSAHDSKPECTTGLVHEELHDDPWPTGDSDAETASWEWDLVLDQFTCNAAWQRLLGLQEDQLETSWFEHVAAEDLAMIQEIQQDLLRGAYDRHHVTYRIQFDDGSTTQVTEHIGVIRNHLGQAILIQGHECKAARRGNADVPIDPHTCLEHFHRIANNMPGLTFRCIIHGDGEIELVYVSSKIREFIGLDPSEIRVDAVEILQQYVHPVDLHAMIERAQRCVDQQEQFSAEFRLILPHRGERWVRNTSELVRLENGDIIWDGIILDIDDLKKTKLDLNESNRKLQRLIENVPGMIYRYIETADGEQKFLDVSPQIREIYNLEPAEAIEDVSLLWSRAHPQDVERLKVAIAASAKSLSPYIHKYRIVSPDGETKWLQVYSRPFRTELGDTVWDGLVLDITDLKLTQMALAETQSKYQRVLENIPGVIFQFVRDASGHEAFTYVSIQIKKIFRIDPELAIEDANYIWQLIHPDDLIALRAAMVNSAQRMEPFEYVFRATGPSGVVQWVQVTARPHLLENSDIVWDGVAIDVSERKHTELALKDSQDQFRRMTENIPGVIYRYVIDTDGKDRITYISNRVREMYEVEPEEAVADSKALWNRVHEDDVARLANVFSVGMEKLTPVKCQYRILLPRKGLCWIESTAFPHRRADGSVIWDGVKFDITQRKQDEMQSQLTNEELRRATQLKDEFVANMSHELRTPLNAILGMAEGLQDNVYGDINARQKDALETIERSGMHLLELINEILDLAKIESGRGDLQFSLVHINSLCKSSVTFVSHQAKKKNINLNLQLDPDLVPIYVDERRLRQVLINLLNNAVKFTPPGGNVTLSASMLPPCETRSDRYLRLSVTDTGCGISPNNLKHLFQPFRQIKSNHTPTATGTGLGLALVKSIVELHEGFVTAISEMGSGSNFVVELPYLNMSQNDLPMERVVEANWRVPLNLNTDDPPLILLAEDNEANVSSVSSYLRAKGFRVAIAKDGETVIEKAKSSSPQVVLMDIQLPGMSGLMAIEQLRQLPGFYDKPIIALTALAMEDDRERCINAGANEYLSKPVKLKQLLSTIESLLEL